MGMYAKKLKVPPISKEVTLKGLNKQVRRTNAIQNAPPKSQKVECLDDNCVRYCVESWNGRQLMYVYGVRRAVVELMLITS